PMSSSLIGSIAARLLKRLADKLNEMAHGLATPAAENAALLERLQQEDAERRRSEEEARAGRQLLPSIIDKSPALVSVKDLHGRYLLVNRRYEELHHVSAGEIVGKTDHDIFPAEYAAALRAVDKEVLAAGSALEVEEAVPLGDDDVCTLLSLKFPLDDGNGRVYAVCGVSTDITERKRAEDAVRRSEEEYRSTVEDALEGIFRVSLDGRLLSANPAFARMLGYEWVDDLLDTVTDVWRQLYVRAQERDAVMSTLLLQGSVEGQELELRCRDGATLWVSISTRLVRDDAGQALFIETFASDIGERKRVEAELKRHQDRLEELVGERTAELTQAKELAEVANQAKSAFLASMSHELRTPLNGVLGFAQILQFESNLTPRQRQGLETIQHSGEHLLALINDILDLAKVEAGKVELVAAPVRVREFVRAIADIIRVKAEEKKLRFCCDMADDLPPGVQADERRLRQVLLNLLGNAVKFTDRGEVSLHVRMMARSGGDAVLRFEVADSGVGIDPEHIEKIFLPFEQVGDSQRRAGGTGLGLAISRQLIRVMGGDIQVESRAGQGSRFWFELRLPVVEAQLASGAPRTEIVGYEGPRRRVLVADDVPANRAVVVSLLESLGFAVIEAADGEELLAQAGASRPDLVIADIVMPRTDGVQATRQLRRTPSLEALPVLLVSATVSRSDTARYLDAGANAFLPKPIDVRQLLQQIGELLKLDWKFDGRPQEPDIVAPQSTPKRVSG
ncbi:MAG TPA: ATP-binding protein, partial [Burkholderiaceae bacterium]